MRENIWKNIKLGFKTNKLAVAGAAAIILLALISIFAFLYPVDPNAISATERLNAPSMAHLFGTDDMGRDYLARCIYGGRASLLVGFLQRFCGRNGGCSADASGGCTDEPSDIPDHDRYECLPETGTSEHCPDHRLSDLDEHCQDRPWRDHFPERERVCHLCKDLRTEEILHHCTSYPA